MEECPEVFDVRDQAGSYHQVVVLMEQPPEALREKVMNAVRGCPNRVIRIEE
jgi:ferredoxin